MRRMGWGRGGRTGRGPPPFCLLANRADDGATRTDAGAGSMTFRPPTRGTERGRADPACLLAVMAAGTGRGHALPRYGDGETGTANRADRRERDTIRHARRHEGRDGAMTGRGGDTMTGLRIARRLACLLACRHERRRQRRRWPSEAMRENKARMDGAIADEMGNARRLLANLFSSSHPTPWGAGD